MILCFKNSIQFRLLLRGASVASLYLLRYVYSKEKVFFFVFLWRRKIECLKLKSWRFDLLPYVRELYFKA